MVPTPGEDDKLAVLQAMESLHEFSIDDLVKHSGRRPAVVHAIANGFQEHLEQTDEQDSETPGVQVIKYRVNPDRRHILREEIYSARLRSFYGLHRNRVVIVGVGGCGKSIVAGLLREILNRRLESGLLVCYDLDDSQSLRHLESRRQQCLDIFSTDAAANKLRELPADLGVTGYQFTTLESGFLLSPRHSVFDMRMDRCGAKPKENPTNTLFDRARTEKVDGLLADLGVSRYQLTAPERGFSFQSEGPLDMRMDRSQGETAGDIVNFSSGTELANLIYELGEERRSRRIARAIVRAQPIQNTRHLAKVIESAAPRTGPLHPATQTFMALRLAVNAELGDLDALLEIAPGITAPGGLIFRLREDSNGSIGGITVQNAKINGAVTDITTATNSPISIVGNGSSASIGGTEVTGSTVNGALTNITTVAASFVRRGLSMAATEDSTMFATSDDFRGRRRPSTTLPDLVSTALLDAAKTRHRSLEALRLSDKVYWHSPRGSRFEQKDPEPSRFMTMTLANSFTALHHSERLQATVEERVSWCLAGTPLSCSRGFAPPLLPINCHSLAGASITHRHFQVFEIASTDRCLLDLPRGFSTTAYGLDPMNSRLRGDSAGIQPGPWSSTALGTTCRSTPRRLVGRQLSSAQPASMRPTAIAGRQLAFAELGQLKGSDGATEPRRDHAAHNSCYPGFLSGASAECPAFTRI